MANEEQLIRQLYVSVAGDELEADVMTDLFRVEVDASLQLPDMCVLCLHDRNARLIDEGPFALGAELRVGVGDEQGRGDATLFVGEITGLEPDYQRGMVSDLLVRAYDRSHRLHRGTHTRTFQNASDSDIAQQLAQAAGLQVEVDTTSTQHEHVFQDAVSDLAFLRQRAAAIGYRVWVQERTLFFKQAPGNGVPVSLEWGQEMLEFRPILSLSHQVNEVSVRGWNPETKREVVGSATRGAAAPQIGQSGTGASLAQDAFGEAQELVVAARVATQEAADQLAQSVLDRHDGGFVEAEGLCVGNAALKPGVTVDIGAVGQRFSGTYVITHANHIWDTEADYLTRFRISGSQGGTLRELLTGSMGTETHWHPMIGIVTNIDDPLGQGRVRVRLPWLGDQAEAQWARLVSPGAGDRRGLLLMPEVNDEVLICFEQGDISRPLVIGGLWNGEDALAASSSDVIVNGSVNQRMLVTREGHKIILSDQNPAVVIIETVGGHGIVIDDDQAEIVLETAGANKVTLEDNAQRIRIEGAGEIQLESSTNLSIRAGGNLDLEASGNTTIRGATVQLNP